MAGNTKKGTGVQKTSGSKRNSGSRKTSGNSKTTGVKKNSSAARKSSSYRSTQRAAYRSPDPVMNTEILCWCLLGASVLMFICVIGFGGGIGNSFGDLLFGIMGTNAFVFPFLVFFMTLYLMASHGDRIAVIRSISAGVLFCVFCGVLQLISYSEMTGRTISDYFEVGQQYHAGGGAIGGALILFFRPAVGLVGTWAVFLISIFLFGALITQKALFVSTGKRGSEVLEERRIRNEELRFEREELRLEREERRREERELRLMEAEERRQQRQLQAKTQENRIQASPVFYHVLGEEDASQAGTKPVRQPRKKIVTDLFGDTRKGKKQEEELPYLTPGQVVFGTAKKEDPSLDTLATDFSGPTLTEKGGKNADNPGREQVAERKSPPSMFLRLDDVSDVSVRKESRNSSAVPKKKKEENTAQIPEQEDPAKERKEPVSSFTIHRGGRVLEVTAGESGAAADDSENNPLPPVPDMEDSSMEDPSVDDSSLEDPSPLSDDPVVTKEKIQNASVTASKKKQEEAGTKRLSKEETLKEVESVAKEIEEKEEEEEEIPYEFPSIDLLERPSSRDNDVADDEVRETARKLEQVLATFGVNARITEVSCGPSVTRYEFLPELGTKVSKITNLADDLKLNLAAADIRIEAPIPGKAAVGIEIPNKKTSMVYLSELIDSEEFRKNHSRKLSYAVGKDISGRIIVSDIAKMPHLLIAGATGSGKSVFINTLIMSIIYNADPSEVKMIMIDPKVVELSVYNGIPHLFIPVVTDPKKAAGALNWGVAEMTKRYQQFAEVGVRNLAGYNAKVDTLIKGGVPDAPKKMPQIVIIVDELADLMMVSGNEVEDAICRLAQLARACGIHLVIATQRPSVDVITGLIKANIPSRIAFAVSSGTDSRTILDMVGAEKLLGNGDMLFAPQTYKKPVRVQGAFVSDEEIQMVVDSIRREDSPKGQEVMKKRMQEIQAAASSSGAGGGGDLDELFADAGRFIIQKDKASIGMLQRWFKIGFNRAARIMDQLSDAGVVGPDEGTKPRKVLMSEEQFENYLEQN